MQSIVEHFYQPRTERNPVAHFCQMMIGLAYTVMMIIEDKLSLGSIVSNQPAISCTSSPIPIGGDEKDQEVGGGGGTGRLGGGVHSRLKRA
jgi:hypothetical protein